ncbi:MULTISPECIES: ATP-binding protein [unclassified Ectothiorhodospira]|uniref:ATP-binding protein n=1 Tax=unclassified Ectothiorhodospira TaxID=2684909 RepID=UPI001EE97D81|nr:MULTISPECIES: ATP-binding protein [unclassified Ectothiorhodospira]MCG5516986.1 ATP-binding protein [Ectothiorhodospira sp. 9100]MCG5520121.1 ATP-binding protein [Ectothiorhodospira sp. 9905]
MGGHTRESPLATQSRSRSALRAAFSLRWLIGIPVVLITVLSAGFVAWLAIADGRDAVNDIARQLRTDILTRVEDQLTHYLSIPAQVNEDNARALRSGILDLDDPTLVQRYFHGVIESQPSLAYSFFGTPEGEFYGARRTADGSVQVVRAGKVTGGDSHNFSTNDLGDALELKQVYPNFDPRTRPWYQAGVAAGRSTWTPIYRHFVIHDLALTASRPHYDADGELLGVFAVDYVLTQIHDFLRSLDLTPNAQVFVMQGDGHLVAASTAPKGGFFEEVQGQFLPIPAAESGVASVEAAVGLLQQRPGGLVSIFEDEFLSFSLDGETKYLQLRPFSPAPGLDWLLAVVVPEKDFMSGIQDQTRATLTIIAAVLLLAGWLGFVMAGRLAAPMERLGHDADELARGQWDRKPRRTPIREYNRLDRAFQAMARQLRDQFQRLQEQSAEIQEQNRQLEQRVAERTAELSRTTSRLRAFFENIPGYIVIIDRDYRIVSVSQSLLEVFGIDELEKVLHQPCYQLAWEQSGPCVQCALEACFQTGQPVVRYSTPAEEARFGGRSMQIFNGPILDDQGEIIGGMVYYSDVTDLRVLERQLIAAREVAEAANQAKSEFLARMSHEIRTPMNAILGLSELVMLEGLEGQSREFMQIIQHSAQHLLTVINDILDLSKIEAGRMELLVADFDLHLALEQMVGTLRVSAREKGLELVMDLAPDVPRYLRGDRHRLGQILINLVGNAIKFTAEGDIQVRVRLLDTIGAEVDIGFEVIDTGEGIPEDRQGEIFDTFTQVDGSARRRYGGTGLGLAITRQLVEKMGGCIRVASRPGQGSTFRFNVVLESGDPERVPVTEDAHSMGATVPRQPRAWRTLLVEDTPANVVVAEQLLKRLGHEAVAVTDAESAFEQLLFERFDLVLMDVEMPGMNGFEATRHIRDGGTGEANRTLPIIGLTAHALSEYRERGLDAGMDDYIFKPISLGELGRTIDHVMSHCTTAASARSDVSEPAPTAPGVDLALVMQRLGGDRELLIEILLTILPDLPEKMSALAQALDDADGHAAARIAHTLKGHLGTIGAQRAAGQIEALETLVRRDHLQQASAWLDAITAELHHVYDGIPTALKGVLAGMPGEDAAVRDGLSQVETLARELRTAGG